MDMNDVFKFQITGELLQKVAVLDEFKGRWEALRNVSPEVLNSLRKISTIESSGASTRIEGSKLTDAQVAILLSGLGKTSFASRDEEEVAGYAATMDLIFERHKLIELTENHVKHLHKALLQYATKDEYHRGEYKRFPNSVEAKDEKGKSLGVIFATASPFDTPRLMSELVNATRYALEKNSSHPLLVIAIFIVRFLAIHPFQDGNGRLSRVVINLLLLRSGYSYVPYRSHEKIIEENKNRYYAALRMAQQDLDSQEHMRVWLDFFLEGLLAQKNALLKSMQASKIALELPKLSGEILRVTAELGRASMRDLVKLTGAKAPTVKKHVQTLVKMGKLHLHGRKRGAWYSTQQLDV